MRLELEDGSTVVIHFLHRRYEPGGHTSALVHYDSCSAVRPCRIPGLAGFAIKHENDSFNKKTGRTIALTRALAPLPRHQRGLIWRAYGRYTGAF